MKLETNSKVVCIDDTFPPDWQTQVTSLPKKGNVYVVREFVMNPICNTPTIRLVGIKGVTIRREDFETGFRANRFRLLSDVKAEAPQVRVEA